VCVDDNETRTRGGRERNVVATSVRGRIFFVVVLFMFVAVSLKNKKFQKLEIESARVYQLHRIRFSMDGTTPCVLLMILL
jgi:hypothetical protein